MLLKDGRNEASRCAVNSERHVAHDIFCLIILVRFNCQQANELYMERDQAPIGGKTDEEIRLKTCPVDKTLFMPTAPNFTSIRHVI
jgi:hypothetical protein